MSDCSHDCSSCSQNCADRQAESLLASLNPLSSVKKVYAVVSGKGGVGKSLITSTLAVKTNRNGYNTAILDADITGPSIPKAFGINQRTQSNDEFIFPVRSKAGIEVISLNLMLENETDPVVWRGPVIAGAVKQFWTDVVWNDVDVMYVDMPPGTGDVPLTVFQSLPIDGIIVVTSPQELVSMIVEKAIKMADLMKIPVVGIVENMSYFKCPDCGKEHHIYGESHIDEIAERSGIKAVAKLPIDPALAKMVDSGSIEDYRGDELDDILKALLREKKD